MKTILIIGAGFSGAVTAVQLLRRAGPDGVRVILLNRSGMMARGLAYGTQSPHHVLNVPAGNMSALDDEPDHFLQFARQRDPETGASTFVSRHMYGDYLESLLEGAEHACQAAVSLQRITGEVSALACGPGGVKVSLVDGRTLAVDRVVLAFGHFPACEPHITDPGLYRSAHYLRDPWNTQAIAAIPAAAPVLLLGSGLTALDVATTLLDSDAARPIHLLSRHGLLPKAHRPGQVPPSKLTLPTIFSGDTATVRSMLTAFRAHVHAMEHAGEDWREALNALRPATHRLWQGLGEAERRRFLRHVQPFWDNHRHRAAPVPHARFAAAIAAGTIHMHAGRLAAALPAGNMLEVRLNRRGHAHETSIGVQYIINCIGPNADLTRVANPLVEQLLRDGLIRPDALRLGLEAGADCAVVGRDGRPSRCLFYIGPLLKARHWEATAVPELRRFAAQLASTLLAG